MSRSRFRRTVVPLVGAAVVGAVAGGVDVGQPRRAAAQAPAAATNTYVVNDSHFHLTNYIQEGLTIQDFLKIMGNKVGRVALFGIPLQQQWSYGNTGDFAPTYYLQTDAPLYYYSFTDASIAMAYRSLPPADQARFDPMITGLQPDGHVRGGSHPARADDVSRACSPASASSASTRNSSRRRSPGETASLLNPALDRLLDFAGEVGLVAIMHNDVDMPFPKPGQDPYQVTQLRDLHEAAPSHDDHLGARRARTRRAAR